MAGRAIDPRLRHALRESARGTRGFATAAHIGLDETAGGGEAVEILLRCSGEDVEGRLRDAGVNVRAFLAGANPIASGTVPLDLLPELAELPFVRQVWY